MITIHLVTFHITYHRDQAPTRISRLQSPQKKTEPLSTPFDTFPFPNPHAEVGSGFGRMIDNPGETDEDGWKKAENGNPCESDSSYCAGGTLPAAPVFGAILSSA